MAPQDHRFHRSAAVSACDPECPNDATSQKRAGAPSSSIRPSAPSAKATTTLAPVRGPCVRSMAAS